MVMVFLAIHLSLGISNISHDVALTRWAVMYGCEIAST